MKIVSPKTAPVQDQSITKLNALNKRYADVFDYLLFSVSEIIDMPLCTITIFDEEEAFVIATTDNSIEKIGPFSAAIKSQFKKEKQRYKTGTSYRN